MQDQKLENLLNLSLSATDEEREKSAVLNIGYEADSETWDLIVKYSGNLKQYENDRIQIVELYNEYAILTVPENLIEAVSEWPEVEYIEKPKRLYFQIAQGKRASCISLVQIPSFGLTGRGVLVGIIDSGIDAGHPVFVNSDGTSRIRFLWDQTAEGCYDPYVTIFLFPLAYPSTMMISWEQPMYSFSTLPVRELVCV